LAPAVLLIFFAFHAVKVSAQGEITSLQALHEIDNAKASRALPTSFDATVIYSRGYHRLLFVQDDDFAIFVFAPNTRQYRPGDRVHVVGQTASSFRPIVAATSITLMGQGKTPQPVPARFRELIQGRLDARFVSVRAKVRAADIVTNRAAPSLKSGRLQLTMEGGSLEAYVDSEDKTALSALLDSEVQIKGVAAGKFDDKMEQTGIILYVSNLSDIRVLKQSGRDPWSLAPVPMDRILSTYNVNDLSERVRVYGTITYYQPGSAVVLESGTKSIWIATQTREQLRVGDIASAIGFPYSHDRALSLVDSEIRDTGIQAPIPPHRATWEQLARWDSSKPVGHQFDLVSTQGEVIAEVRGALEDEYVLSEGGRLFSAIYRHPRGPADLLPMRGLPLHSTIRVTGICIVSDTGVINPGEDVPFDILLRSFDDIEITAAPPIVNIRNLLVVIAILVFLLFLVGLKAWMSERRGSRQIANSAYMERKRAQILADINGKRPLNEILDDITQMVTFKLRGIPCWCQVADGARIGNLPQDLNPFRVVEQRITGLSGSELGTISAGLDRRTTPQKGEIETLSTAASVAALAIETRRLYSDLVHRSEFDELTEIHNRFSFERHLEEVISETRDRAGICAVIYIDLNDFKKINDNYGHLVGDLYLAHAASQMKSNLRGSDMLGRLGGDEFAVIIPLVHNRAEVDEVVHRLELAFQEPVKVAGYELQGSASFGFALYPEDGVSKDELLSAADAAMYVAKQTIKETEKTRLRT
jgi:diguanylate cyclase (GGDEF)-like protein